MFVSMIEILYRSEKHTFLIYRFLMFFDTTRRVQVVIIIFSMCQHGVPSVIFRPHFAKAAISFE